MNQQGEQKPLSSGSERSLMRILNRIDRNEWMDRAGLILFMVGAVGFAFWIRLKLLSHMPADPQEAFLYLRNLLLAVAATIVAFVGVISTKLQIETRRSTREILRALQETRKQQAP